MRKGWRDPFKNRPANRRARAFSDIEDAGIERLRIAGFPVLRIARQVGRAHSSVQWRLNRLAIEAELGDAG